MPMKARDSLRDSSINHRRKDTDILPSRTRGGRPRQDLAHAAANVEVDLAGAVLASTVQQCGFSFGPEARYDAHGGRGCTAQFPCRGVAAQAVADLEHDPAADPLVGRGTSTIDSESLKAI